MTLPPRYLPVVASASGSLTVLQLAEELEFVPPHTLLGSNVAAYQAYIQAVFAEPSVMASALFLVCCSAVV